MVKSKTVGNMAEVPPPVQPKSRLIALTDWPAYHPWPTVAGLRMMVFHAPNNGAGVWIKRIGRRVLVSETDFFRWVDAQQTTGAPR